MTFPSSLLATRIGAFLETRRGTWRDFNVPYEDGRELERLVLEHRCTSLLEIGTSTGHSTLWLAKAVAQTGGKVLTLEQDRGRHDVARRHFAAAGAQSLIDARLGDAWKLLPTLTETFDFVFSDATWSTQPADGYLELFRRCDPRLRPGGLFVMHNVTDGYGDDGRFFAYLETLGTYRTHVLRSSSAGMSVSVKLRPAASA